MNAQDYLIKMDQLLEMTKAAFTEFAANTEAALRAERPQILAVDEDNIDTEKFKLDKALLRAAPIVAVPAFSEFQPLQEDGHRFLLARGGLYLEIRRPWLKFIHRLAEIDVHVPYGPVKAMTELSFGTLGKAMPQLQEFALHATAMAPNEAAAALMWNSSSNTWRLAYPDDVVATPASISYTAAIPSDNEHMVIDLHSHGNLHAFFSDTDDKDDAGSVKIAGVYGSLDKDTPTVAFRLCALGLNIPINVPAEKIFA
ncbi:PRTRC system protein A [Duganella sp. CT11-25]|uniref:PRTRC system protein A n=1 Tax=unclassified Duganella TaxID=2636909 RepID=UPI0039B06427